MPTRCILFDLFGTLVQYDAGRVSQDYTATYQFVRSLGSVVSYDDFLHETELVFAHLDAWSLSNQQEFSMIRFATDLFAKLNVNQTSNAHLDEFADLYTREWAAPVTPVPGVQSLLSRAARQFVTGVITNTHHEPMVRGILERYQLGGFTALTTSVSHGRPKPHADIFKHAMTELGVTPEECVYVGDNYRADYLGAKSVGMTCYLIGQHARVPREFQIPSVVDLPLHLFR